jgi:transcriptional regulator with XRE-family HTH domain
VSSNSLLQNEQLGRLLSALKGVDVDKGRNKKVAEKTGYSEGSVKQVLAGRNPITGRFITAVCNAFDINQLWVETGFSPVDGMMSGEPSFTDLELVKAEHSFNKLKKIRPDLFSSEEVIMERLKIADFLRTDVACFEALKELLKMSEVDRWRAVVMLKEMNDTAK